MSKITCFRCAKLGHMAPECKETNLKTCPVAGCGKIHNKAGHDMLMAYLAKMDQKKIQDLADGKNRKRWVKSVSVEVNDTPAPGPAVAQPTGSNSDVVEKL